MRRTKSIYLPALAVLLLLGCIVLLAGTTFARYQFSSGPQGLLYQAKEYAKVYLWSDELDDSQSTWEVVDRSAGALSMSFCVSNGADADDYSAEDQEVTVRLAATLGIQDAENTVEAALLVEGKGVYSATIRPIERGTPLYAEFGGGWLFTFLNEEGEEQSWTLEGGGLSVIPMQLYVQGVSESQSSMLQVQVSGDVSGG